MRPRLADKADQFIADGACIGGRCGPGDAEGALAVGQIAAVAVGGDHLPSFAAAGDPGHGVGMVVVAMGDDAGFGCRDGGAVGQQVSLAQAGGAGEAGDQQAGLRGDTPQAEIGEIGVERGIGVAGEPAWRSDWPMT